jgi:membrane protein YqaA with SNARE-associated domain
LLLAFLTTFGYCVVGALVPFLNTELYLIGASAISPPEYLPAIVAAAALGQMVGKSLLFYAGRGALSLPSQRLRRMVEGVQRRYSTGGAAPALGATVIIASSGAGLPPFYITTIACGIFRIPYAQFFGLGLVGMLARFTVVVAAPQVVKTMGGG